MDALLFRTRVTGLWLTVAIAASGSLLLYLFMPGALEEMVTGEMEGETLTEAIGYFLAAVAIYPLVMAVVTVLVSDRVNHSVNLIAGLVFGLFGVFAVVGHVLEGGFNVHVLMMALGGVGAFVIAGLSLAGLRHPASEAASTPSRYHRATTA